MSMIKLKNLIESIEDVSNKSSLTKEEKMGMYEAICNYNEYRNSLKANSLHETVNTIKHAVELAESYTLTENHDWMESRMIKDDMKEMNKISENLCKESEKIKDIEKQMELFYEQLGLKLERYFEIKDIKKIEESWDSEKAYVDDVDSYTGKDDISAADKTYIFKKGTDEVVTSGKTVDVYKWLIKNFKSEKDFYKSHELNNYVGVGADFVPDRVKR